MSGARDGTHGGRRLRVWLAEEVGPVQFQRGDGEVRRLVATSF